MHWTGPQFWKILRLYPRNAQAVAKNLHVTRVGIEHPFTLDEADGVLRPVLEDGRKLTLHAGACRVDGVKREARTSITKITGAPIFVVITTLMSFRGDRKADHFVWFYQRQGARGRLFRFYQLGVCPDADATDALVRREDDLLIRDGVPPVTRRPGMGLLDRVPAYEVPKSLHDHKLVYGNTQYGHVAFGHETDAACSECGGALLSPCVRVREVVNYYGSYKHLCSNCARPHLVMCVLGA